ncbi:MAG: diacylglycerol kinase family lipid kinase [Candidatus Marinimicrobia bacterium]|nr:diacylglycerol kinase family lipid kinase [Candidatus Neomarinimicrobiota bacterium]
MNIQLIYNPNSGGGRGDKLYPLILKALRDKEHAVTPYRTLYRFHAMEIAKHIDVNSCDLILAVGGDGTAHEVLNGIMQNTSSDKHPLFGLIPVGTGNSFSKDLNFKNWGDGIKAVEDENIVDVDLLKILSDEALHYSMNCTGFGFVADVNILGNKMKKFIGKTAYTVGALIEIMRFRPHKCKIEVDGVVHKYKGVFTNFSNSVWIGGNMKISPNSIINDGIAECLVLEDLPKKKLLKVFPKVFDGSHLSVDEFKIYRGKHFKVWSDPIKLTNPDGEIYGATPLEITVMPKEIRMLTL